MTTTPSRRTRQDRAPVAETTTRLWHPFSHLRDTLAGELSIVEGRAARVRDSAGRWYLDATAGLWYANVGHGRTEIAEALRSQAGRLAAYSTFGDFTNPAAAELAERLAAVAPVADPMVFLTSGGSDAVDTAVKMARRYWTLRGEPDRTVVLSRRRSYHGMHGHGTALAGIPANATGYGNLTSSGFRQVPDDDADALRRTVAELGAERVAAFFVEPIIGAGGVYPPAPGYLAEVAAICRQAGILLVVDEVITGFGRTGEWFASGSYGIEPDLLLFAKGVTSGYVPLGGVITARPVWEVFAAEAAGVFRHGYTYSGHATACAAALANLRILADGELFGRAGELAGGLATALRPLAELPGVRQVRHGGFLAAVALDTGADPTLPDRVVRRARELGVLTRVIAGDSLQLSPPFVLRDDELRQLIEVLGQAVTDAVAARPDAHQTTGTG